MEAKLLDHKLDCKKCGVIRLNIPKKAPDDMAISCSSCGSVLGTWGALKADFYRQTSAQAFDLDEGKIREVPAHQPTHRPDRQ
jgi:transcription elongation factor Elf1